MPKSPLTKLPNIWPIIANNLMKIGITTPEEFLQRDPYEVFHELKTRVDHTLCRCALASIVWAHEWKKRNLIRKESEKEFLKRYPNDKFNTARKNC